MEFSLKRVGFALLIFLQILSVIGCAPSIYFEPVIPQNSDQTLFYSDGKPFAVSKEENSTVSVYLRKTERIELLLEITYQNNSEEAMNVLPDLVEVQILTRHGNLTPVRVYEAEAYMKMIKRGQAAERIALALLGAVESYNAGTTTTYGSVGGQPVYLETYDYSKQAAVDKRNREEMNRTRAQQEHIRNSVENGLIKRNTLLPGYYVNGNVMADYKSGKRVYITVPFGKDVHVFEFEKFER